MPLVEVLPLRLVPRCARRVLCVLLPAVATMMMRMRDLADAASRMTRMRSRAAAVRT